MLGARFQITLELRNGPKKSPGGSKTDLRKFLKTVPYQALEPPADPGRGPDRPKCVWTAYMQSNSRLRPPLKLRKLDNWSLWPHPSNKPSTSKPLH